MKNPIVRSIMQRTGALLLVPVLCVSALAVSASAENPADKEPPAQLEQQITPEADKRTQPNNGKMKPEKKGLEKKDGAEKPSIIENPRTESEAEMEPASDIVSVETVQVHPGDSVIFSGILENSMDSKSSDNKDDEMKAALSVEIASKAKKTTDEKSAKKDSVSKKDASLQQSAGKEQPKDSAKETDNTEEPDSLTYSWQVDRKNGKGWKDLKKAIGSSYQIKKVTKWQNGWEYRCVISKAELTIESSSIQLQISESSDTAQSSTTAKPNENRSTF